MDSRHLKGEKMSKLLVRVKVFPDGVEVNLDDLTQKIADKLLPDISVRSTRKEPIAFGIFALIIDTTMDEKENLTDELEKTISEVDHVSQVEVIGMSNLSTTLK